EDGSERRLAALPSHLDALRMMPETIQIQAYLIVRGANHLANLFLETRLAISAEAHHLVFVAVLGKSQKLGKRRVEQAQRVRELRRAHDLELIALADAPH